MDTASLVHDASPTINAAGTAFMFDPGTFAAGEPLGLGPFETYFLGRGGVLGDVDPDVVVAAFGIFEPGMVRTMWEQARAKCDAATASSAYNDACAGYGRRRLSDVAGLDDRLAEAEAISDRIVSPAFDVLDEGERRALADGVEAIGAALQG